VWQQVHYHSAGHRLNPNLYNSGEVCLSLLNTWSGDKNQMWTPGVSTMLQVLVSIQGLILNAKPYFNEPGYASLSGTQRGDAMALQYNENTFILSVRTMTSMIRNPPKVWFYSWFISFISLASLVHFFGFYFFKYKNLFNKKVVQTYDYVIILFSKYPHKYLRGDISLDECNYLLHCHC